MGVIEHGQQLDADATVQRIFSADAAPTTGHLLGQAVKGSLLIDRGTPALYICTDASTAAWALVGPAGG